MVSVLTVRAVVSIVSVLKTGTVVSVVSVLTAGAVEQGLLQSAYSQHADFRGSSYVALMLRPQSLSRGCCSQPTHSRQAPQTARL